MSGLADLMARVYPGKSPQDRAMIMAQAQWARAVPASVARNALPVRLQHGILTVHTTTAAWANTLQFEAEQLLVQLRASIPDAKLRRVDFRVGPLPELPRQLTPRADDFQVSPAAQLPEEVAQELARIQDDGLRDAIAQAVATGLGRARSRDPE